MKDVYWLELTGVGTSTWKMYMWRVLSVLLKLLQSMMLTDSSMSPRTMQT
jgi:hypothetical protein